MSGNVSGLCVVVVDDEELARDDLAWLLRRNDSVGEVITVASGQDALRLLTDRDDVDALFVDIQMPGLDGVELVKILRNFRSPPPVAFVTAYDEYAVDAFDLDVCDYLKKPVDQDRLEETLRRMAVRAAQIDPAAGPSPNAGGVDASPTGALPTLVARVGNRSFTVDRDDVDVVEASGDYVRIRAADESFLVRESISSLTSAWSACGFVRIHRSFLVRGEAITEVRNVDGKRSVQVAGSEYPVSRRYTRLLQDHLGGRV
ncbi:MAG: LytTR family DNA-binding domain-containing protein [Actinomycetota bacterium]